AANRHYPVAVSAEAPDRTFVPTAARARQLVHRTAVVAIQAAALGASEPGGAIDVTRFIKHEVGSVGASSVAASGEAIEHSLVPRAECCFAGCRWRCQAENDAAAGDVIDEAIAASPSPGGAVEAAIWPK